MQRRVPVMIILVAWFCGCSNDVGPWKEEVRLSDGRQIVVERHESLDVTSPIGDAGAVFLREATIRIVAPAELAVLPELVTDFRPVILDYDAGAGAWFAIAVNDDACGGEAFHGGDMNARGTINERPNREFRIVDGQWKPVEILASRLGLPANLLVNRSTVNQFDVMPLAEKTRINAETGIPREFRWVAPHIGCR